MLKKIALVLMLALPMGVFAQNLKFGHINAQENCFTTFTYRSDECICSEIRAY